MNILIVHAHHEPKSFCSALSHHAAKVLRETGHTIEVSDLYQMKFDPVSDRRNFTTVKDADYLKQQNEETYATEHSGFAPNLEAEMRKLEKCDALLFTFPLWWFGLPAILKGWVDRVFAMGRIYGGGKLYEGGLGQAQKRAMAIMTTGGPADAYSGYGVNPPLNTVLAPVQHGVFWFNGYRPLAPFVAWSAVRISQEEREKFLAQLEARLKNLFTEEPLQLAPLADFPNFGFDTHKRFMVTLTYAKTPDEDFANTIPAEKARVGELNRQGKFLDLKLAAPTVPPQDWRGFILVRETSPENTLALVRTLPLAPYFNFEITELMRL